MPEVAPLSVRVERAGRERTSLPRLANALGVVVTLLALGGLPARAVADGASSHEAPRDWRMAYTANVGGGLGDLNDAGFGATGTGVFANYELARIVFGKGGLWGLGFGTCLYEGRLFSPKRPDGSAEGEIGFWDESLPCSFFPLYVYLPVWALTKPTALPSADEPGFYDRFVYLFAGGSAWGMIQDYAHLGATAILWQADTRDQEREYGKNVFEVRRMAFSMTAGLYYSASYTPEYEQLAIPDHEVEGAWGGYFALMIGYGGVFR